MACLAHAERIRGNRAAACGYLARAQESFAKARPMPYEAASVSEGMKKTMRDRAMLHC
jgi:hypothetical protein